MANIQYMKRVKDKQVLDGIMELLTSCDQEFVPALSSRSSTTQLDFAAAGEDGASPRAYFESLRDQPALVALEGDKVLGFMSFRKNVVSRVISKKTRPNLYVTTVVVHRNYREKGIGGDLYDELIRRFDRYHIFTRTWSTNPAHTALLYSHNFDECYRLPDDRGEGIDTVYYCHKPLRIPRRQMIQQCHLTGSFIFLGLLIVLTFVFVAAWFRSESGVLHELFLACATSMMASILCLCSELFIKYMEAKNDAYIQALKGFGIENLLFHKDDLLKTLIPKCSKEIWISGYRLIMTARKPFLKALETACKKHKRLHVRVLTVAPWSETFHQVYGKDANVAKNYLAVFDTLCRCRQEFGCDLVIRMTKKPIFSDTYKVDDRFITGPYLHCKDKAHQIMTARDFFSLDINDPNKDLYKLICQDYIEVWDAAPFEFDCDGFFEDYQSAKADIDGRSEEEKLAFLKNFSKSLTRATR